MKKKAYYLGDTIDRELSIRAPNGAAVADVNIVSVEVAIVDPNGIEAKYVYGTHPENVIHPSEGYYKAYLPTDAVSAVYGTWWVEWEVTMMDDTAVVIKYTSNPVNVRPRKSTTL